MTIDLPEAPNPAAFALAAPVAVQAAPIVPATPAAAAVEVAPAAAAEATPEPETAPEPATEPVAEAPAAAPADSALPPELELIDQIWGLYREQCAASIEQQQAAIEQEAASKKYAASAEKTETKKAAVRAMLDTFCERLAAIRDPHAAAMISAVQSSIDQHESENTARGESAAVVSTESIDYTAWLKIPTKQITDNGIAGLGPKKVTALLDAFPTMADLEAARTEAGKENLHFCKKLVRGIGEQTADAIYEAMDNLLFNSGGKRLPKPVAPIAVEQSTLAVEPKQSPKKVKVVPVVEPDPDFDSFDEPEETEPEPMAVSSTSDDDVLYEDVEYEDDDAESKWAEDYHRALLTDNAQIKSSWGANDAKKSKAWLDGNSAHGDWPLDSCPFDESDDLESAKDWVRGWTAANILAVDI